MDLKEYNAKKYFIYGFKEYISNKNRIISKRHFPSIREIVNDYINMYEQRIKEDSNKKLESAEADMIESVQFYLKESIFYHDKIYKKEIDLILNNFEKGSKKNSYIMCQAFLKKMQIENFYTKITWLILQSSNYSTIAKIIYSLVSELQYDGYSLTKLDNWYNDCLKTSDICEGNINQKIEQFSELKQEKRKICFYISIKYLDKDTIFLQNNMKLVKVWSEQIGCPEEVKKYLPISGKTSLYKCELQAMDRDKGLEYLINAFDSYIQMNNYVYFNGIYGGRKIEVGDKIIAFCDNEYYKVRKVIKDEKKLFHYNEEKEKRDIERFIQYRDHIYEDRIANEEVANIQRALNIVKGQGILNKESRVINLWSVLEYMLTFHEGKNIISKVQDIIPKVVALYVIKDEINMFWRNLQNYKELGNDCINKIISNCSDDEDNRKYDLKKLIEFILSEGEKLMEGLAFNDVLMKEICTIGSILDNKEYRKGYIEKTYNEIKYDLIKIYRARNILVHSGRNTIQDINGKVLRLYSYNNSLLGVIIYYKSKNPFLTIQEILSSICCTYESYSSNIDEDIKGNVEKLVRICRPSYLFLE